MEKQHSLVPGIYCLHSSFLEELSQEWLTKEQICKSANLFMAIATASIIPKKIMTCDRTKKKMDVSKYCIGLIPGIWDLIDVFALLNSNDLDDDEYSLRLASFKRIGLNPVFLITSDEHKKEIKRLAESKKYTVHILSQEDFALEV